MVSKAHSMLNAHYGLSNLQIFNLKNVNIINFKIEKRLILHHFQKLDNATNYRYYFNDSSCKF